MVALFGFDLSFLFVLFICFWGGACYCIGGSSVDELINSICLFERQVARSRKMDVHIEFMGGMGAGDINLHCQHVDGIKDHESE